MISEEFERKKICYEQNFLQARSINDQMNRIPILSITLTGGLWFGAALTENVDMLIRFALLLFAGLCNITLVLAIFRVRDVLQSYFQKIKEFDEEGYANGKPLSPKLGAFGNYGMISLYAALMLISSIMSFLGSFFFYWPFNAVNVWCGVAALVILMIFTFLLINRKKAS